MNNFEICKIKRSFYIDHPGLDKEANTKEGRLFFGIIINVNDNHCFVPFETKLYEHPALKANSQYDLPSSTRPKAGLNFEKCLIINDFKYLEIIENPQIANSQYTKLKNEQDLVKEKLEQYIQKYIAEYKRGYAYEKYIFKYCTLHEFKKELGLE